MIRGGTDLGFYLLDLAGERFLADILGEGSKYRKDFEADETSEGGPAAAGAASAVPTKPKFEFVPPAKKGSASAKKPPVESK